MILLTVVYTFEVFLYLGIEEMLVDAPEVEIAFQAFELFLLTLFIVDVVLNVFAFRRHYFHDRMAIVDIIIITLTTVFVFLDIIIES